VAGIGASNQGNPTWCGTGQQSTRIDGNELDAPQKDSPPTNAGPGMGGGGGGGGSAPNTTRLPMT